MGQGFESLQARHLLVQYRLRQQEERAEPDPRGFRGRIPLSLGGDTRGGGPPLGSPLRATGQRVRIPSGAPISRWTSIAKGTHGRWMRVRTRCAGASARQERTKRAQCKGIILTRGRSPLHRTKGTFNPFRRAKYKTVKIQNFGSSILNFELSFHGGRSSVGRALGCGPSGRGFKPRRSPQFFVVRSSEWGMRSEDHPWSLIPHSAFRTPQFICARSSAG